jgi:hypothetical protein
LKTANGIEERLDAKALQYLRDEAVAFDIGTFMYLRMFHFLLFIYYFYFS